MADSITIRNPAIERMKAGEVALGMIVRVARTVEIARIAKSTGHDFLFLDKQHAPFDVETIANIAQVGMGCGVATLVRTGSAHDADIPIMLDAGVMGIVAPDVNTAADARRVVDMCKYAPVGKRSVGGAQSFFDFRPTPLADSIKAVNDATLVVCMIETAEGLRNLEEIAAVPGIDVLHIGCNDLLTDLGKPGQLGGPEIMAAIDRLIAACKKNGKFAGLGGDKDIGRQGRLIREGIRFVTTNADIAFLMTEASKRTAELRKASAG